MALSRIWSAFIIIAISVAAYKCFMSNDKTIFSRLVTGKADDAYDTVYYQMQGNPQSAGFSSVEGFNKYISGFGYVPADSLHPASIIIADKPLPDIAGIKSYTFSSIQWQLTRRSDGIIETCKTAVTICIGLIGIMALFMGMLSIAEKAGGIQWLSRLIAPFFSRIFPGIPKGHPAYGHMMMNFSANFLNLDNAATPFGLKAMQSMQELNKDKETASDAQLMFLCLHASGLTLIPVTVIAWRASLKAASPTDIFIPCMIATFAATLAALLVVSLRQRINLLQPVLLAWIGGISLIVASLAVYLRSLDTAGMQNFSGILSNGLILLIFLLIVIGGWYKKIDVFDAFVEGAKGGFETAVKIIPYLVGMLVAISLLRTSGTFDVVINGIKSIFTAAGADTRFVDGLPTALIKPLSGSGARGMMIDTMKTLGPDSFAGRLSCILQGSSDTTFYVIAVYFGAVSIKNTRYAISTMLLADLVGILTSIGLCYLFFSSVS
ncbi:MAG: spore maturation protein [Bacteroidetes bacterium]|nr:spore maturation protein [Bacteroidota bacterium]